MSRALPWSALLLLCAAGCSSDDKPPEDQPTPDKPVAKKEPAPKAAGVDLADLAKAEAEEVALDGRPVVVAGRPGGATYEAARGFLQEGPKRERARLAVIPSDGALDGLYWVAWGYADFGFTRADVLGDPRQRVAREQVMVVATGFAEEVHVLVQRDGPVKALADLEGKPVGAGAPGSGSVVAAERLLDAADVFSAKLVQTPLGASLEQLARGELAAVVAVGGAPLPELVGEKRFRLLSIDEPALLERLKALEPTYAPATLAYPALGEAKTVGSPALVVVRTDPAVGVRKPTAASEVQSVTLPDGRALALLVGSRHPKRGFELALGAPPAPSGPSLVHRDPALPLRLAGGPAEGPYQAAAAGLARALAGQQAVEAVGTSGSLQNLMLLAGGQAELALVREDLLLEALRGPETARVVARVRVLAPLFAEEVHLLRGDAAKVEGPAALKGLAVGIDAPGSDGSVTALRLLRLLGLEGQAVTARALPASVSLERLKAGKLDAAFFVGSRPHPALSGVKLPFVPLKDLSGYRAAELPAGAYESLGAALPTVSTRALLCARFDLPADQAKQVVAALFAHRKNLATLNARFSELRPEDLSEALPAGLAFHEGAEKAREGLAVDTADPWK